MVLVYQSAHCAHLMSIFTLTGPQNEMNTGASVHNIAHLSNLQRERRILFHNAINTIL